MSSVIKYILKVTNYPFLLKFANNSKKDIANCDRIINHSVVEVLHGDCISVFGSFLSRQTCTVNSTTLHCNWKQSNIILVLYNMLHLWCNTPSLSRARSANLSAEGRQRDSEVGKFASPGDTAGQGVIGWQSFTKDQAISFEEIGYIPFCSEQRKSLPPLSPSPSWFLRFRHLKDEREQEVNSAIL